MKICANANVLLQNLANKLLFLSTGTHTLRQSNTNFQYITAVSKIFNTKVFIHRDPKKLAPNICRIALSFRNDFSNKATTCLRKLGTANSNLIRVPPAWSQNWGSVRGVL